MEGLFQVTRLDEGVWEISDFRGCRSYLVVGSRHAALIDTGVGVGDLRSVVNELCDVPITVLLTHRHHDHVAGSSLFDDVRMVEEEDGFWEQAELENGFFHQSLLETGSFPEGASRAMEVGRRPKPSHVREGDVLDLGGISIEVVLLPGHTDHSTGYLVRERRLLVSGDAVTPIMCLFFKESTDVGVWRQTLEKMRELPFDTFRIGHYSHAFTKDDLDGFEAVADYVLSGDARGMDWMHTYLPDCHGTLYILPSTADVDAESADFRALIGHYIPRPHRSRRRRRSED